MIKSGSTGELVEERVGDRVSTGKFSGNYFGAVINGRRHPDHPKAIGLTDHDGSSTYVWQHDCKLLHRPFAVGDTVIAFHENKDGDIVSREAVIKEDFYKTNDCECEFRFLLDDGYSYTEESLWHANESWRDAPEWEGVGG